MKLSKSAASLTPVTEEFVLSRKWTNRNNAQIPAQIKEKGVRAMPSNDVAVKRKEFREGDIYLCVYF